MASIAITVIDDGRPEYLRECVASIERHIPQSLVEAMILINDCGDADYADSLRAEFPQFDRQVHHETRRGLAGGVKSAWETALEYDVEYVFHVEGDFVLTENVSLGEMSFLLMAQSGLAQLVLKRNPVNDQELACGGQVETSPDEYEERHDGDLVWTEHSRIFSFNPSLISRSAIVCALDKSPNFLEREVTDTLITNGYTFAFWGGKFDPPKCHHIGTQRSSGYHW